LGSGLLLVWAPAPAQSPFPPNATVYIGFSPRVLGNVNQADVTAAMRAWFQGVIDKESLPVHADIAILGTVAEIEKALRGKRIDVISASTDDFVAFEKTVPLTGLYATVVNGKVSEEYLLLVHRDQATRELKDLRGQDLFVLDQARTTLASLWLDTELLRRRLPVTTRFFGKLTHVPKPSQAILPVFFKQAGAALVTRAQFNLAAELNPQLARDIRILAHSPEVIPTVGAVRADVSSGAVRFYQRQLMKIHESEGGKQMLKMYQTDGVAEIKLSDLAGTRALLAEYARLRPRSANH
jgi:phosphonate transport system substrate-binding protein